MKKLPTNLKCKELKDVNFLHPMALFLDGSVKHPEWGIFLGFKNEKKHKVVGVHLDLGQAVFLRDFLDDYIKKCNQN